MPTDVQRVVTVPPLLTIGGGHELINVAGEATMVAGLVTIVAGTPTIVAGFASLQPLFPFASVFIK
jgi:hypothetical protein